PTFGLFVNLAGLYGFWRRQPALPKDYVYAWPLFLLAILLVVIVGARAAYRDPDCRRLAKTLLIAGSIGYLLALGDQGPTGAIFRWLVTHVPGFEVMREAQKFIVLVALAYAVFFGFG